MSKQKDRTIKERLASIEAHVEFIKDNMAHKSSISFLKWAVGGIGSLAISALLLAAKGAF